MIDNIQEMGGKSMRKGIIYGAAILALIATFALPELILYKNVDHFNTPMRLYRGDVLHYLGILNAGRVGDGPTENVFFAEWAHGLSNFYILQTAAGFAPGPESFSIVWLALFMQIGVAILVFFSLRLLLRLFDIENYWATLWAFLFVLLYGSVSFRGSAFSSWFFPFMIIGIYSTLRFYLEKHSISTSIKFLAVSLLCFSLQPIYFFLGIGISGLLWLLKLKEEYSRKTIYLFCSWLLAVGLVFYALFWPFIAGLPGSEDVLLRFVSSHTRIPFHLLFSLRLVAVMITSFVILRANGLSDTSQKRLISVGVLALVSFLGLNSYLITGTYVANDHYTIIEDLIAFLMLATVWYLPFSAYRRSHYILGWMLLAIAILSIFDAALYLNFSVGYSGKFILFHIAYLFTALLLLFPRLREIVPRFERWRVPVTVILVIVGLLYANLILYKDTQAHITDHQKAQAYRPLVETLLTLPPGVVLGDPTVSNITSLFTNHKVYWHSSAYGERVTTPELHERFLDAKLFFADSALLNGESEVTGVFGSTDHCIEYKRFVYLKFLSGLGFSSPYQILCLDRTSQREAWRASLDTDFAVFVSKTTARGVWSPQYRFDYLVVTPNDKSIPQQILKKYFVLNQKIEGGFSIYKKK